MITWSRMRKKLAAALAAVMLVSLFPQLAFSESGTYAAVNLLADGSFEGQTDEAGVRSPWGKWGGEHKVILDDPDGAADGSKYVATKIDYGKTSVHQAVTVQPHTDYTLTARLKLDATVVDALTVVQDTYGSWSTIASQYYSAEEDPSLTDWKQVKLEFNSGTATDIEVEIGGGNGGASGTGKWVYIDDVKLVKSEFSKLDGTVFGLPGSWGDSTFDKMFDGNPSTIYDYVEPSGGYAGIDLGEGNERKVVKLRFYPREGGWVVDQRMVGGRFQGSNTAQDSGYEDIYVIDEHVHEGWNEIYVDPAKQKPYRYLRYLSAEDGYVNLAEAEFYTSDYEIGRRLNHVFASVGEQTLLLQESKPLRLIGQYSDSLTEDVTSDAEFASSNSEVVAVSDDGVLTGLRIGSANVTAEIEHHVVTIPVQVVKYPEPWTATDIVSGPYGPITGIPFGTEAGIWADGRDYDAVFDGNPETFFDSKQKDGAYAGLDFEEPKTFTKIRFYPRDVNRANGALIQGSNDGQSYITIHVIGNAKPGWNEVILEQAAEYRYARFVSPTDGYGNMAELEFVHMPISDSSLDYRTNTITADVYGTGTGGSEDYFHFIHAPMDGPGSVQARIDRWADGAMQGASAGLMVRVGATDADAAFAMLGLDHEGDLIWQFRSNAGTASVTRKLEPGSLPVWLKLERTGEGIAGSVSEDNETWVQVASEQMLMPSELHYGIAVSSGSGEIKQQAAFSGLQTELAKIEVSVDPDVVTGRTTSASFSLNGFNAFNPDSAGNPEYLSALDYMKPGLFRLHGWHMMDDSSSENGWLLTSEGDAWDGDKINRLFSNLSIDGEIMVNIPSWPKSMDIHPENDSYDMLDPAKYEEFAQWCADLVRIVNIESNHGVKYWEITNEKDDPYYVHLVNNGEEQQMAELAKIYNMAAARMKEVDPSILTGGPAYARPDLIPSVQTFVDHVIGQTEYPGVVTLDFLSYHFYGSGNKSDGDERIYDRSNDLLANTALIREMLDEASPDEHIELYLDEYNVSWSYENNDPRMQNHKGGVFDALVMIKANEAGADGTMAWNEKDGIYGKVDGSNQLRPGAHVYHMFNEFMVGKRLEAESSVNSAVVPMAVKAGRAVSLALVNRTDALRETELLLEGAYSSIDQYQLSEAGYNETLGASIDFTSLQLPAHSVTVLVMHEQTPPDSPPSNPSVPTPRPPQADPGKLIVNEPQADKGKIAVKIAKGTKEVLLPADASAVKGNALRIEGEDIQAEVPAEVMDALQDLLTQEQVEGADISFRFEPIEQEEASQLLGKTKAEGVRLKAAGPIYSFRLAIITKDGQEKQMTEFLKPVTINLKVDESADRTLLGAYYISEDGKLEYVGGHYRDGLFSFEASHFSNYAVLEYEKRFSDVAEDHWAYPAIKQLAAKHVIADTSEEAYSPDRPVTRVEFAAMIASVLRLSGQASGTFSDVESDSWYADEVSAAYEAGIVSGKGGDRFMPHAYLTREEMAVMLVKAVEYATKRSLASEGWTGFADDSDVSEWARRSVTLAAANGLLAGRGQGRFAPQGFMTRAESAQAISKIID